MYTHSEVFLMKYAEKLEDIWNDMPPIVKSLIDERCKGVSSVSLIDLYMPNACFIDHNRKLHKDIFSLRNAYPDLQCKDTVRLVCRGQRLSGKTMFLKAIFCSLVTEKKQGDTRWWHLSYNIKSDSYPFYLTAAQINQLECPDFETGIMTFIKEAGIMRRASGGELSEIIADILDMLQSGRFLLLIDDADKLAVKKIQQLKEFLSHYPSCHVIMTITNQHPALQDVGEQLFIPRLTIDSELLQEYTKHLCTAFGLNTEYPACERILSANLSIEAYCNYYVHTPCDLIYVLLSTGIVSKKSMRYRGGKLNVNSILKGFLEIRKPLISTGFLNFFSQCAYIAMVNHTNVGTKLENLEVPKSSFVVETPNDMFRSVMLRSECWDYLNEGVAIGLLDVVESDDFLSKQFVFADKRLQAYLAAYYLANEQDLSELPAANVLISPESFFTDFLACLFDQERRVFLRVFKKIWTSLSNEECHERTLLLLGLLWRIDWKDISLFHGDIADCLLKNYFLYCDECRIKGELEHSYWRSGCLFYADTIADLLSVASDIQGKWVEEILYAATKQHYNAYDNILSVLLKSSLCSEEFKKKICRHKAMSSRLPLSDIAFFQSLDKNTLSFMQETFLELSCEKEMDIRKLSEVYAELISVLYGSSDSKLMILRNLFFAKEHSWQKLSAIYLLKYMEDYGVFLSDIVTEVMEVVADDIDGIDPDYEAFIIDALNRIDDIPSTLPVIRKFQIAYVDLLTRNPEQIEVITEMLVALETPKEVLSTQCISFMKNQYLEDEVYCSHWAKLLLLADEIDFLADHLITILHMRQAYKGRFGSTDWWDDILVTVTQRLDERTAFRGNSDLEDVEIVELDGKEYVIANRKEFLNREYIFLGNYYDPTDFCIRRVLIEDNQEYLAKLENTTEFNAVLQELVTDTTRKYSGIVTVDSNGVHDTGSDQFAWDEFVNVCNRSSAGMGDFIIDKGTILKYTGTDSIVVIPQGITVVGENAFRGCQQIQGVIFQEGVLEIKRYAFADCAGLKSVEFVESIERIEQGAFIGTKLKEVVLHSPCRVETSAKSNGQHLFLSVGLELPIDNQGVSCCEVSVDKSWPRMFHSDNITWDGEDVILTFPPKCRIYTVSNIQLDDIDICTLEPPNPHLHPSSIS